MDLKTFFEKKQTNMMEFALKMGVSLGHLYQIMSKTRRPSVRLAKKIEEATEGKVTKEELLFPEDFEHDS